VKVAAGAPGFVAEGRRVFVEEEATLDVGFRLCRGQSISGIVVDEKGAPLPGIEVKAIPLEVDETLYDRACSRSRTGEDGRFLIEGVRPGTHDFEVNDGHSFRRFCDLRVEPPASGLRIEFGRSAEVVARIRVPAGATPPDSLKTMDWTVFDNGSIGEPSEPGWQGGTVTFTRIAPGRHRFEVKAGGFLPLAWEVDVPAGGSIKLQEVTLDPGLPLGGRVEDVDGRSIPGAIVRVDDCVTWTDAEGRFSIPHLPGGETTMRISAAGFQKLETTATLPTPPVTITAQKEPDRAR
jgi:hypothetical protein